METNNNQPTITTLTDRMTEMKRTPKCKPSASNIQTNKKYPTNKQTNEATKRNKQANNKQENSN